MERFLENAMYASRWLLAPVYFGLSLGLIALTIKFFQEIFHILPHIFSVSESDMILTPAVAGGYDPGGRFAGDGDVLRV